jgi:hypothetical protein
MSAPGRGVHASTLGLFVLVLGLAVYMYVTRDKPGGTELATREGNLFASWRREDIREVSFEVAGERGTVERRPGASSPWGWKSPWTVPADPAKVDALTLELERARPLRPAQPDALGPARAKVTVQMGAVTHTIVLHGESPSPEGSAYARVGDKSYVVSKDLALALLTPLDGYRERALVPSSLLAPSVLRLRTPAFELTLERQGEAYFRAGRRASREQITQTLSALGQLRVDAFLSGATKEQDAAPMLSLRLEAPGLSPVELDLGGACGDGGVVARRKGEIPLVSCVPGAPVRALHTRPAAYDDAKVFASAADETAEFAIEAQGVTVDLARRGSGFHLRTPEDRDLSAEEAEHVTRLLAYTLGIKGIEPAASAPAASIPRTPLANITLHAGERTEHVQVFAGGQIRRHDDGVVLAVDPEAMVPLSWPRLWTRSVRVFPVHVSREDPSSLGADCGTTAWRVQRGPQGFVSVLPQGARVDGARAVALLDASLQLRVERWVAPQDDGAYGTRTSKCRVSFGGTHDGGNTLHTLIIGTESGDSFFARVEGAEPVMRISKTFVALVRSGVR